MTTVTFSMTPDYVVEKPASQITFNFDLDQAPAPGDYVSVWIYGSDNPNAPVDEARHGGHTLADFDLMQVAMDPSAQVGMNIFSYNFDVSVEAGVSNTGTFHVLELRLTQQHNTITLTGFDDGGSVDDAPRSYYWNVVADPNENPEVQVVNGSLLFTEYTTPDEVPAANIAPEAADDTVATAYGEAVMVDVLANDTDADGDALSISALGTASNGSVELVDGQVVYTPKAGFSGADSFTYTVSDGQGGTSIGTVQVTVGAKPNTAPVAAADSANTAYGEAVTVDVLANDTDADGDSLSIQSLGAAGNGSVEVVNGQVVYTPNEGFSGADSFTYTVSDGKGGSSTGTVSVEVDEAPVPGTPIVSITADKTVLSEDNLDAVTLTFHVENLPAEGLRVGLAAFRAGEDGAENTFKFGIAEFALYPYFHTNPDGSTQVLMPTYSGIKSAVGWEISDGLTFTITSETATVTMPLWPDPEDLQPGEENFFRNSDTGVDTLIWRLVDYQNTSFGAAVDAYEVAEGQGEVELKLKDSAAQTYEANDAHATTNGREIEIDVLALNPDAVEIVAVEDSTTSRQGLMQHGIAWIDDKGTADTSDDTIVYRPEEGYTGRDYFSFLVRNAEGELDQARVTVDVTEFTNEAPVAAADSATTAYGEAVTVDVLANDTDADGDALSISALGTASNGSVEVVDGQVVYTPQAGFSGSDSFTYTVSDGQGGSSTGTVQVTVGAKPNTAPVAGADSATTAYGEAVTVDVLANDTDADGDALSISALGTASNGSVEVVDGQVVYTPKAGFSGSDSFTYTVSDGQGGSSTGTVQVTVGAKPNTAPVAGADSATTAYGEAVTVDVLANDTDADGDALSISALGTASNGSVEVVDGQVVYTPKAGFSGSDSFTYTVSDGQGGSSTGTVQVTVGAKPNTAPVAAADSATTAYGEAVTVDVLANDTDADGDALSISALGTASNGSVEVVDGQVVYTPQAGFSGSDSFTYTVSDGQGGSSTGTVQVTVGAKPNTAPVAGADSATTAYGEAVTVDVLANDTDADGDALSISALGTASNGSVEVVDGQVVYTPKAGFSGSDSFTYTVSDGQGGSSTGTVQVTVGAKPNTAPVAGADSATTAYGEAVTVDVLANDTDADGDALSISALGTASNGSVEVVDGQVVYTPKAGFSGSDSFTYTVSDGQGGTSTGTVQVTVGAKPNTAPVAAADSATTAYGEAVTVDVLANDTDADGDALSISALGTASNGSVEVVDGQVVYTPQAGFSGSDSFTYTVSDGQGGSSTGTVQVTVGAKPNTAPVAAADSATTAYGEAVTVDVLANDTDADGDALSISALGTASNGSVELVDGQVVYTPQAGFSGSDSFTYTVSDGQGGSSTGTVSVEVGAPARIVLEGTGGTDVLSGSSADETLIGHGGPNDVLIGGGGADVFEFRNTLNGKAEAAFILDFGADDQLDLGGAAIAQQFNLSGTTYLILEGDGDRITLLGFSEFDANTHVVGNDLLFT